MEQTNAGNVQCPKCMRVYRWTAALAGRKIRCHCSLVMRFPATSPAGAVPQMVVKVRTNPGLVAAGPVAKTAAVKIAPPVKARPAAPEVIELEEGPASAPAAAVVAASAPAPVRKPQPAAAHKPPADDDLLAMPEDLLDAPKPAAQPAAPATAAAVQPATPPAVDDGSLKLDDDLNIEIKVPGPEAGAAAKPFVMPPIEPAPAAAGGHGGHGGGHGGGGHGGHGGGGHGGHGDAHGGHGGHGAPAAAVSGIAAMPAAPAKPIKLDVDFDEIQLMEDEPVKPAAHAAAPPPAPAAPPAKAASAPLASAAPAKPVAKSGKKKDEEETYELLLDEEPAKPAAAVAASGPAGLPPPPAAGGKGKAAPAASAKGRCPSCGLALKPGAVLCINCGFNTQLGQTMQTEVAKGPAPVAAAAAAAVGNPSSLAAALSAGRKGMGKDDDTEKEHYFKEVKLPAILAVVGLVLILLNAFLLPSVTRYIPASPGVPAFNIPPTDARVEPGTMNDRLILLAKNIGLVVFTMPFLVIAIFVVARLFSSSFGNLGPAMIKLTAMAVLLVSTGAVCKTTLDYLTEGLGFLAYMISDSVNFAVFFTLAAWLFEMDGMESLVFYGMAFFVPSMIFAYAVIFIGSMLMP